MLGRVQFTDDRPQYQYPIAATQVVQRISAGGVILTLGEPQAD